jgi:signal transduction histidine kinase
MISLKRHLSWGLILSLITLLTLQWIVVSYVINNLIEDQLVSRMQREGESLLTGTYFSESGELLVDAKYISTIYERPFSGHYYVVSANKQSYVSRSLWDFNIKIKPLNKGQHETTFIEGPEQQPLLLVTDGYQKQGYMITIAIAENLAPLRESMTQFQLLYAGVSLLGLMALLLIQRLIVLKVLKPLQQVQAGIAKLVSGEESQIANDGPEEISPLIEELNRILASVQSKSKRSRESLGNLAHALKSKLTLLNQIAERQEMEKLPIIRKNIYTATESISHHIERELKKARLMGEIHPAKRVELKTEIAQIANTLQHMYIQKAVNISWEISPNTTFYGDREDLLEMLGNLLDNACKWCKQNVLLTVHQDKAITFTIEDDGPGCAENTLELLVQRGFRADESTPGSGLGLAITNAIATSYGADLTFGKSTRLGGLLVKVRFPIR